MTEPNEERHDECGHGPGTAWTLTSDRRFFARCDTCHKFRLWADYFEVYTGINDDDVESCWWWECKRCLLKTVFAFAESEAKESTGRSLGIESSLYNIARRGGEHD